MSCDTSACITWHQCLYHVTSTSGLGEIGWVFLKVDYNYLTPLFTVEGAKTSEVSTHMLRHHYSATAHVTAYLNSEPNCIPSALLQNSAHMLFLYSHDARVLLTWWSCDTYLLCTWYALLLTWYVSNSKTLSIKGSIKLIFFRKGIKYVYNRLAFN